MIGVDEHVWRHNRRGEMHVTVAIDLTRSGTAPAPHGCWTWTRAAPSRPSPPGWPPARRRGGRGEGRRDSRFTGVKTATTDQLPDAVAVMDPFQVERLVGDAMDTYKWRVQQQLHGHRGRTGDPLYSGRRTLHNRQRQRLRALFSG